MDANDVVVRGRHCSVTERFRNHAREKLDRLERFSSKIIRVEVEVSREKNPRRADRTERVEITVISKGPAIRAEAAADDRYGALDLALDRLLARLRKAADRRRIHHGSRTPVSVAQATNGGGAEAVASQARIDAVIANGSGTAAAVDQPGGGDSLGELPDERSTTGSKKQVSEVAGIEVQGEGPLVVREKVHNASPITLDQALYEMELVGHDFFLFVDADSKLPSVVYRRKGYDYGVIRLEPAVL